MDEKKKVAYALNMWTVSVSQIIDYNDVNIMEQEYNNILNNLNLENMPKDEALLDVIKMIMDEITNLRIDEGDRKLVEMEYQHQIKNAIWNAVPSVGGLFAGADMKTLGVSVAINLATQIGTGYMNYRRSKANYELGYEKNKWQIQKNRLQHLNGLQQQLFETAWRLSKDHGFDDEYRLTANQITMYNQYLQEENLVKRFNSLKSIKGLFEAYPPFWYFLGSTANSIYQSDMFGSDVEMQEYYQEEAVAAFEKYKSLYDYKLIRNNTITSACYLEYFELLYSENVDSTKLYELVLDAEKQAGNANDILEICAFSYLRLKKNEDAIRIFEKLVNDGYNAPLNAQILSGIYIYGMRSDDEETNRKARIGYKQLMKITDSKYILDIPADEVDLSKWNPGWDKSDSLEEVKIKEQLRFAEKSKSILENKKEARRFYSKPIILVVDESNKNIAEYYLGVLNDNRERIDPNLPTPSICLLKEYERRSKEYEASGTFIIFIGDSKPAKSVYRITGESKWDYYQYNLRFFTNGNKAVLLTRPLKNKEVDDFINWAKNRNNENVPDGVFTIRSTFLKDIFGDGDNSAGGIIAKTIAGVVTAPLLVAGQSLELFVNAMNAASQLSKKDKMKFLQYDILLEEYLISQKALVKDMGRE